MQRSAIFSCLLEMDGYGQVTSDLGSVIISDISDWWGKMPTQVQRNLFESNVYLWVQKYAELVKAYFGDRTFLSVDDPANRFKLSQDTQRWEAWAAVLILANERNRLISDALDKNLTISR